MATLTGNTIASTYTGLLSVTGAVGADTVEAVTDGAGTSTSLSLSQQRATITLGSGAADDFIVDGTTFVVEGDNNRVGIGTASPSYTLDLASSDAIVSQFTGSSGETILSLDNTSTNGDKWYLISGGSGGSFAGGKFGIYNADTTTAVATFTNDGNVGIGTISPGATLHTAHSSSTAYNGGAEILESVIIQNTNGSDGSGVNNVASLGLQVASGATSQGFINYVRTGDNTGDFTISQRTGSSAYAEHMRITSGGNVGIGTTSPNISGWNANYAVLTIKSDTTNYGGVLELANPNSTGNYFGTVSFVNMDGGSSTVANARISGTRDGADDASALTFETEPTGGAVTERMRIDSAGTVIIKASTPTIQFQDTDDGSVRGIISQNSTVMDLDSDSDITFSPNNTEAVRITSGGAVCIARTSVLSPTAKLVVSAGATGGTTPAMSVQANTATASGSVIVFHSGDGGECGAIGMSNLNAGNSVAYNTSSDYRLKQKVKTLPNGLDRVNQMKPVEYEWKKSKSKSEGFLAHELQEICDYAVTGEKDGDRMQQIDYAKLTPILVKAVQELSAKVEALENA